MANEQEYWTSEKIEAKRAQNIREGKPPYSGIGGRWSTERRERHGVAVKAAIARRKRIQHRHVSAFAQDGQVHESLLPIIASRGKQAELILRDLGGPERVSAMEVATVDSWLRAAVVSDAMLALVLADPSPTSKAVERFYTGSNLALKHLQALGLKARTITETESLETIATEIASKATQ